MPHSHIAALLPVTMLTLLASSTAPVRGSSVGFHEYLKHEHSETVILPKLYEPVPKHVPVMTDQALLRFWSTHQSSPIYRNAQIEIQLYEAVNDRRNLHPVRFDHYHPTLGHLLRNPEFCKYALHLYNTHTARFVHYHHRLIPILRGCA